MNNHLQSSEKKLVRIFIISALIFLLIFEGIFLISRHIIETNDHKKNFLQETNRIISRNYEQPRGIPRFIGIESIQTTLSGEIISSQIRDVTMTNINQILDAETMKSLEKNPEKICSSSGYLIRKIERNNGIIFFFTPEHFNRTILMRDVARFIVLNFLVLIPLFYMIRLYIRRVLRPVRENIDTMTHFVHDAGHELKTPLAIISGNLQILRDSPKMDYELIEESLKWIDTMNESIHGLLELADLKIPENNTKTHLKKIIENEINRADNFRNIKIINTVKNDFSVYASEKHISLLLRNLIENAIKYNKDNGKMLISLEKNTLTVEDTGIGMSEENISRIFDRFYRINQNSEVSGSGIGMTLVKKVVDLYDWKITISSEEWKWTKISVHF